MVSTGYLLSFGMGVGVREGEELLGKHQIALEPAAGA